MRLNINQRSLSRYKRISCFFRIHKVSHEYLNETGSQCSNRLFAKPSVPRDKRIFMVAYRSRGTKRSRSFPRWRKGKLNE